MKVSFIAISREIICADVEADTPEQAIAAIERGEYVETDAEHVAVIGYDLSTFTVAD